MTEKPDCRPAEVKLRGVKPTASSLTVARAYLESGSAHDAEACARAALNTPDCNRTALLLVLAESLRLQGKNPEAQAVRENIQEPTDPTLRAEANLLDARLLFSAGRFADCVDKFRDLACHSAHTTTDVLLQSVVAASYARLKDIALARELVEKSIGDSERLGWQEGLADGLLELALLDRMQGHWSSTEGLLLKARESYGHLGLSRKYIVATLNLGLQRLWRGHLTFAEEALREATRLAVEIGDIQLETSARADRGLALTRMGRVQDARADLAKALRLARRQASPRRLAIALEYTGELHLTSGALYRASEALRRALAIANRIAPDGDIVPEVLRRQAEVALALGDLAGSTALAGHAAEKAERLGDRYEYATALRVQGQILQLQGEIQSSRAMLRKSLEILDDLGETFERDRILKLLEDPEEIASRTVGEELSSAEAGLSQISTAATTTATKDILALLRKHGMIGSCRALVDMMREVSQVASLDIPVLVEGETGTGKELVARAIHEMGQWSRGPMVAFNCATCPTDLLDAELFGHTRGAYTGAFIRRDGLVRTAMNGTLFLDEIGELREESQARLLRFLDSGEIRPLGSDGAYCVRVRVIAATHVNLEERIRDRRFRRDLYFRLAGLRITLPPLRERRGDIRQLIAHFVDEARRTMRPRFAGISEKVILAMESAEWPGNIRQLKSEVQRLVATAPDGVIADHWVPADGAGTAEMPDRDEALQILSDAEELRRFLIQHDGRVVAVAKLLGVSKGHLYRVMKRNGIDISTLRSTS